MTGPFVPPSSHDRWEPELGIVFSSFEGFVWASWPDTDATLRLGRQDTVTHMMRDFLAQEALGDRLTRRLDID